MQSPIKIAKGRNSTRFQTFLVDKTILILIQGNTGNDLDNSANSSKNKLRSQEGRENYTTVVQADPTVHKESLKGGAC